MIACSACSKRVRKTQRAIVMTGPGTCRPGRVCNGCAALGWLLVLGGDPAPKVPAKRRRRGRSELVKSLLEDVFATPGGRATKSTRGKV